MINNDNKKTLLTLETVFLLITVLIAVIIYNLYISNSSARIESLNTHKVNSNKISWAIAYFFIETKNQTEKIANSSQISNLLQNKDQQSKISAQNTLENLLSSTIYQEIILTDNNGKVLITTKNDPQQRAFFPVKTLQKQNFASSTLNDKKNEIFIYIPCFVNQKQMGYLIALISPNALQQIITDSCQDSDSRISLLSNNNNIILTANNSKNQNMVYKLDTNALTENKIQKFKASAANSSQTMFAVKTPIKNTNLYLLNVAELKQIIPGLNSSTFFICISIAALTVISGSYILTKKIIKTKISQATLKQTDYQQETIQVQNITLSKEINQHQKSKDALLRAKKSTDELIRQLKEAVKREKKLAQQANAANIAKSEFLANMSHELKTPLQGILGFADFGIQKADSASTQSIKQYFSQIKICGDQLHKLITTLLDIVRIDSGKIDFTYQPVNIAMLISLVIDEFSELANQKNISIKFDMPDQNEKLTLDSSHIQTVIRNILSNAIKYSPENSIINITLNYDNQNATVSIQDNGPGIPPNELETIFDSFQQSSRTKTGAGGTGLGLCLSKKIIQQHNGKIWAQNLDQAGTKISFQLPSPQKSNSDIKINALKES